MVLSDLFVLLVILLLVILLVRHLNVSQLAKLAAQHHTAKHGVTLLDQSVLLTSMKFARSSSSLFAIERRYSFEFSTLGDQRYKGHVIFKGNSRTQIELEPFKVREVDSDL